MSYNQYPPEEVKYLIDLLYQGPQGSVHSLDWQASVLTKSLGSPPANPSTGDRYIINSPASGDWSGYENNIAEWNGSSWTFIPPSEGFAAWVEDENTVYIYDGSQWVSWAANIDHTQIQNIGSNSHDQIDAALHSHTNKTLLDVLIDSGLGTSFLSDDGLYKLIAGGGDMLQAIYDIDTNGIVDKAESIDDGAGNVKTASQIKTHIDDVASNPHSIDKNDVGLANVPNLDTTSAIANDHIHTNKSEIDLVTDGNHDIRTDNPHDVQSYQIEATSDQVSSSSGQKLTVQNVIDDLDERVDNLETGGSIPIHTHTESDITDLDHYTSGDFGTDFSASDLASLGTKNHSDLNDDEPAKHRLINDGATGAADLWSAQKIDNELLEKSDNIHTHPASDIPVDNFEEYSSSSGTHLSVQNVLEDLDDRVDAIDNGTGSGVTILAEWKFSDTLTATDPGAGKFKYDDIDPTQISNIYMHDFTNNGLDASAILSALKSNDVLYIQQKNDSLTGILFTISGSPVDNTGWWTIPVTYNDHVAYLPINNKVCSVVLAATAGDGHTHTNLSILNAIANAGSGSIITVSERNNLHIHTNKTELNKVTVGDHDVTEGNPHNTSADEIPVNDFEEYSSSSGAHLSVQDVLEDLDDRVDVLNSLKGEDNTASNQGAGGVGLYINKVGVDLRFKNINNASNKVSVVNDAGNNEIDIDIVESNVNHDNLSGSGIHSHAQIDNHIDDNVNPHDITADQIKAITPGQGSSSSSGPEETVQDAIDSLDNRIDYVEVAMDTFQVTGERANNTSNVIINIGGIAMSVRPFILPYNCTLYAITAATDGNFTWSAEVHISGSLVTGSVLNISADSSGYIDTLNVDFNAGDKIELYCNGTSIAKPMITAIFRRR